MLSDMRQRVNSVDNPLSRQEVMDALSGEQITRKSATDLMWRVGQEDAAWKSVTRPFDHQFATVKHAILSSLIGQTKPEATAQRVNDMEADAMRKLRKLYDAKDTEGLKAALDPTDKRYILGPQAVSAAKGDPKADMTQDANTVRQEARKGTLNPAKRYTSEEEIRAAKVPDGTVVIVNGRRAVWNN